MIKLDYTLESPEERKKLVEQIISENPQLTDSYLEILSNYLVLCLEKQEKKEKKLLTENRLSTVTKRETSFEGLVSQLENGEDGIYNMINDNKNTIFQPKIEITKADLEEIPGMKELREAIEIWEAKLKTASGKDAFIIKNAIIDLRKDQYLLKNSYRKPIVPTKLSHTRVPIALDEDFDFDDEGYIIPSGVSLIDKKVCSMILCNYAALKEEAYGKFDSDLYYLMEAFDDAADRALTPLPMYRYIVEAKIDGAQNAEIQEHIEQEFGIKHSLEYISSLWRNKIPKLIASTAEDDALDIYYLSNIRGKLKRCSRCGQIKLAHNKYFSKNKTSKDGLYSLCKQCRNSKNKE